MKDDNFRFKIIRIKVWFFASFPFDKTLFLV